MRRLVILSSILPLALLLFSCGHKNNKNSTTIIQEGTTIAEETLIAEEPPIIKDSIDILIEQRAEQEFNSTIFSGLRFGSSRQVVEKTLKNKQIIKGGLFHTEIPIQVPKGDNVEEVVIRDFDAIYYNGRLASLVLYANEANLMDALAKLYSNKYGDTKNNEWQFSNCEIALKIRNRKERVPEVVVNYLTYTPMYYNSYRNQTTKYLTKEPCFIEISYKNYNLLESIERQQHEADSLEQVKRQREIQKEKELAKKLETEIPTNI